MDNEELFFVVVNHEDQYSIWPEWRELPLGWTKIGASATRSECLQQIEKLWTDMRPMSVRNPKKED
jgi:MbtH protein